MRILILSVALVLADQASKLFVRGFSIPPLGITVHGMPLGVSRPVLGDFFRITYIENPGMAFGIDIGGKLFFSLVSLVASVAIILYLHRVRNERLGFRTALAMILGGAVGNLIDRAFYGVLFQGAPLFHGRVVDFFDVDFFDITLFGAHVSRWPVFNIADASVTVGVLLLFLFHRSAVAESVDAPVPGSTYPPLLERETGEGDPPGTSGAGASSRRDPLP